MNNTNTQEIKTLLSLIEGYSVHTDKLTLYLNTECFGIKKIQLFINDDILDVELVNNCSTGLPQLTDEEMGIGRFMGDER